VLTDLPIRVDLKRIESANPRELGDVQPWRKHVRSFEALFDRIRLRRRCGAVVYLVAIVLLEIRWQARLIHSAQYAGQSFGIDAYCAQEAYRDWQPL
jgi:hypothetical protein